jgi:hypothetical protein
MHSGRCYHISFRGDGAQMWIALSDSPRSFPPRGVHDITEESRGNGEVGTGSEKIDEGIEAEFSGGFASRNASSLRLTDK